MRSLGVFTFAILLADFTYGQTPPTVTNLDAGDTLYTAIITFFSIVEKCYLETPNGRIIEFKPTDESDGKFVLLEDTDVIRCRANITDLEVSDTGLWTLHANLEGGTNRSQSYNLTVNPSQELTTQNPEIVETTVAITTQVSTEAPIRYLDEKHFDSRLGDRFTIFIEDNIFVKSEACRIITPSGQQYDLQNLNVANVEAIEHDTGRCAINIFVQSKDVVGNWTLISVGSEYSERIERRLPFSINVEEIVEASVSEITVVEGNDFYVRLKNATANHDTCRLLGPNGNVYDTEVDSRYVENCGYIVRNAKINQSGDWAIVYGDRITYRALIRVTVNATSSVEVTNLVWTRDQPVNVFVGPKNAIYCKIQSPEGYEYYNGFGRCEITIDRVESTHAGTWKLSVGLPGKVLTQDSDVHIRVVEADAKPIVTANVVTNKPIVTLTCSVSSPYPIHSCKFRHPSGRILLANEGVGEDRFSFHGAEVSGNGAKRRTPKPGIRFPETNSESYQSNLHTHDCGLQITNPVTADLGLWRCAVETEGDVYYGFLTVLCPWAMRDPEVAAAVVSEPTLTANRRAVTSVVGDSVTMSCSVQSAIRYCYFRARNGTVFNVGPADYHDLATYVGAGFDAGECGIRFPTLSETDTGAWSCHVGFNDASKPEQRATIELTMHAPIVVNQGVQGTQLLVEGQVYNRRQLEYCRFVRIDGLGFTDSNVPQNYVDLTFLSRGACAIAINNPSMLDHHPWTVVAKIRGQDVEISAQTTMSISPGPGNPDEPGEPGAIIYYRVPVLWITFMVLGLSMVLLALLFGPVKNRQWTYARASAIRNSFTRKAAAQSAQNNNKQTAMAA